MGLVTDAHGKSFPSIGRCIYCPATEDLSDEHIIPLAFKGRFVFLKASCEACSRITSKFELLCARDIYGALRLTEGYPSRSKRKRPTQLEVQIEFEGSTERRMIPVDQYPASPVLSPILPAPGILIDMSPQDEQKELENIGYLVVLPLVPYQNDRLQRLRVEGSTGFAIEGRFGLNPFTRLLAKIAHGFAVAAYGIDSFQALLPDYILDRDPRLLRVVGGTSVEIPLRPSDTESRHAIHIGLREMDGKHYLSAFVQLFRYLNLPVYEVIVGKPSEGLVRRLSAEHDAAVGA